MAETRSSLSSAKKIAVCTLLSRITGLLRDMLILHGFGAAWVADAFWYAFQFPNLFRRLFGEGALAAVFVPTFTRTLETESRPAAWQLLARILAMLTVVLFAVVVLFELVVGAAWLFSGSGNATATAGRQLLLGLTAVMLPFMVSICILALLSSVLNCVGSFVPAALAPILLNLVMIAATLAAARAEAGHPASGPAFDASMARQAYWVAASVLVAGVLQVLVLLPAMKRCGVPLGWRLEPGHEQVRGLLRSMGPVAAGQGVLLLSTFLDTQVCMLLTAKANWLGPNFPYPLQEGALTAINAAARLYQFPLGVLVISLGTAALPEFSRMAARGEWPGWAGEVRTMLRLAVFEGVLAGAMMIVLAEPIVRLLFEYRKFTAADTQRSAAVLAWYGVGMWAFCAQHIVQRAFYSISDVKTPFRIACAIMPVNLALSVTLVWIPGVRESAFAISSVITSSLGVIAGMVLLRRKSAAPIFTRETAGALGAMVLAAGLSAGVVLALDHLGEPWLVRLGLPRLLSRGVEALGGLGLGMALFLGAAAALRLPEFHMLVKRRAARRAKAMPPAVS